MAQTFDYQNENQAVAYDDNIYHVINNVKYLFERQEKQLKFWKSRAQEVEDEKWRDKTLQRLAIERDNAIQDLQRGFGITEEEKNDIQTWIDKHIATQHNGKWRHSDLFIYEFTPTSIGVIGGIYCQSCMNKAFKAAYTQDTTISLAKALYDAEYFFQDV